ncbi:MAG: hypothetical protein ACOYBW_11080 [Fluviibacter phosphoraccumulans]
MLKTEIKIDDQMPSWAENYLAQDNLLLLIEISKEGNRLEKLDEFLESHGRGSYLDVFHCNVKGNVVFKWNTAQEKTMFMLRWS